MPSNAMRQSSDNMLSLDAHRVRRDFPMLQESAHGKPLVFLDSAASAQKPEVVLDAVQDIYRHCYANIHRGVYYHSAKATELFEDARSKLQHFIGAAAPEEIIFTRGATEGINLVAQSYGRGLLREGDEVILSQMEHHSNIVPWQLLRDQIGIRLVIAPITEQGEIDMEALPGLFTERTKLVAMVHASNALGTINPMSEIIRLAHANGAVVLLDGCQSAPFMPVDVQALDADFYVFSGHKLYGPSGIGVLYGKRALLEQMPPWQGGGEMIQTVSFEHTAYAGLPHKFEAGTPAIAEAIGLGAAADYVEALGLDAIAQHGIDLQRYAAQRLTELPQLRLIGTADDKCAITSFVVEGMHASDVGTILDREGIAVRTGHHCAQPVMAYYNVPATIRASFGVYNTEADVDALVAGVEKAIRFFS